MVRWILEVREIRGMGEERHKRCTALKINRRVKL
jgi:hypothetical protein